MASSARECLNCGNVGTADLCAICADEDRRDFLDCGAIVAAGVSERVRTETHGHHGKRNTIPGGTLLCLVKKLEHLLIALGNDIAGCELLL